MISVISRSHVNNLVNEATVVINKPACNNGDVLLLFWYITTYPGAVTWTPDAAFTYIGTSQPENYIGQRAYYRVVNGTEGATFTFTVSANRRMSLGILVLRGANVSAPLNAYSASTTTGNSVNLACPSLTTTVADCLLAYSVYAYQANPDITADPAGMTAYWEYANALQTAYEAETNPQALGATGIKTAVSDTSTRWAAMMVAIAPGGGDPYYVGKNRWGHLKAGAVKHTMS